MPRTKKRTRKPEHLKKKPVGIRAYPEDINKIRDAFGSYQKFINRATELLKNGKIKPIKKLARPTTRGSGLDS